MLLDMNRWLTANDLRMNLPYQSNIPLYRVSTWWGTVN
jgi:hypothetical protein